MNPFNIMSTSENEINSLNKNIPVSDQIKSLLEHHPVVLFMKGNADFPQCGFSANTVSLLRQCQANFKTFNILNDPEIRQGLKEFSNWPTYPQLYIKGELIGGNDIVQEMFTNGELQTLIKEING